MAIDELTREFLIESQEGLDRMERCLTELEERPQDAGLMAEIFRSVHTIKGTTGFLGFKRLEKLAHAGENLLGLLREGKLTADGPMITGLLQLLDGLRSILKTIETEDSEGEGDDAVLIARLEELQAPAQAQVKHARVQGRRAPGRVDGRGTPGSASAPHVRKLKAGGATGSNAAAAPAAPVAAAAAAGARQRARPRRPARKRPVSRTASRQSRAPQAAGTAAESTLRVDVTLLNRMMNLVGELVLTRNQVLQATAADPNMTLLSRRLDMVTADLRESVMKARMQPVSNIFSKMPRIVRDLSQSLGRRVRLQVEGQETELDKSLLEAIKDPLTHAVSNSLDHGIEPPDVRAGRGQGSGGNAQAAGRRRKAATWSSRSPTTAPALPWKRCARRPSSAGLITPERAAQLGERELLQLIFLPGFSTAAAVTNVSGRGVGMDVVRTNVEKIGGKVEIDSRAGQGNHAAAAHSADAGDYSGADCAQREAELCAAPGRAVWNWCMFRRSRLRPRLSGWKARRFTGCAASCCRWCFLTGC